jgi:hypothetical protein
VTSDVSAGLALFTSATAAIVTSAALVRGCLVAWRATYGGRRDTQNRLVRLAVGVGGEYVVQTLGVPTFGRVSQSASSSPRAVWVLRHCIVAAAFEDDGVAAISVITTDRRFHPSLGLLSNHQLKGGLGKTTLQSAVSRLPSDAYSALGASTFDYAEEHYFGRPGAYLYYTLSASHVGSPMPNPPPSAFSTGATYTQWPPDVVEDYRRSTVPTAITTTSRVNVLDSHRALMGYVNEVVLSSSYGVARTGFRDRIARALGQMRR